MIPTHFDCVIVANGEFPSSAQTLELLKQGVYLIACDGAVLALLQAGFTADAVVGDLDSISTQIQQSFADRLHYNPDQETNDLTKAAQFARSCGFRSVVILGATGMREDHTLANISLLVNYQTMFDQVWLVSDYGTFVSIADTTSFDSYEGEQISIFSLFPHGLISSEGLKYPIVKRSFLQWWEGSLNESIGERFTLALEECGSVLVYFKHR